MICGRRNLLLMHCNAPFFRRISVIIISENKIQMDPSRTEAILKLPTPHDVKFLRSFIGLVQFCHKFIKDLNVMLAPLYELLKSKQKFIWTHDCEFAFHKLRTLLTSPPVLYSPSDDNALILETNSSDIRCCFKAVNEGEFVIGYIGKKFNK